MIQPLHYFPCINAFAIMLRESSVLFDGDLPFQRSSFRNRMIVSGAAGPITLSIPIVGGRNVRSPYKEVKIDYTHHWQRDHFRTLCTVYGNSPFFQFYKDEIEVLYNTNPSFLFDWNLNCLKWVYEKLKMPFALSTITTTDSEIIETYKNRFPSLEFTPQNYSNPEMGPFVQYQQIFQERNGFQVNLSIIDLMFHYGKDSRSFFLIG